MGRRALASAAAIVVGVVFVVAGVVTAVVVSNELAEPEIVTPDDACLPGRDVRGPFTAYCQAQVSDKHAREATGGLTYAQLPRDDPRRETAMQASFLRASLFTSVVAFGVAAMAVAMGVVFVLIGLGMRDVRRHLEPGTSETTADASSDDASSDDAEVDLRTSPATSQTVP